MLRMPTTGLFYAWNEKHNVYAILLVVASASTYSKMPEEIPGPHKDLARRLRAYLARRKLTVNSASVRFPVSRESITAMKNGWPLSERVIERWAAAIGEDVNEWRALAGYENLAQPAAWNPQLAFLEGIRRILVETGADFTISAMEATLERASPEEVEASLAAIRARVLARQAG